MTTLQIRIRTDFKTGQNRALCRRCNLELASWYGPIDSDYLALRQLDRMIAGHEEQSPECKEEVSCKP